MNAIPDTIVINTDSMTTDIRQVVKPLNLVSENDSILTKPTEYFDFDNPPIDPVLLASQLVETLKKENGLGLSANQCGLPYNVFVMGTGDNIVAFFNAKLTSHSQDMQNGPEGCLSYPGLILYVNRPSSIQVEYQDYTGATKKTIFSGLTARCFLHELDHMKGVVFTKTVKPLALKMALEKRKKAIKRIDRLEKKVTSKEFVKKIQKGLKKHI